MTRFEWAVLLALLVSPALAQEAPAPKTPPAPPLALVNARIDGHPEPMTIVMAGGKIRAIAPGLQTGNVRRVDARGLQVIPGRIDAWASLGSPDPRGRSLDAFDTYDEFALKRAWRGGVTTVVLTPYRSSAISGLAAVIKLKPGPLSERVLVEASALCTSLGLGSKVGPLARAAQIEGLRRTFRDALAYRDALEDYDEKLEKYTEELKKKDAEKDKGKPSPKGPPPKKPGPSAPPAKGKGPAKPKGPTKPQRPRKDEARDLVLRVLDRELPLRVEAHRTEDIVNALELAEEFDLRLILEGASEAHLLAGAIAKREVPVVLGPILQRRFDPDPYPVRHTPANAALLAAAGVHVVIGTDRWEHTSTLRFNAGLAGAHGLEPAQVEAAMSSGAAELIGLGDRLGKIETGYDADLVVVKPHLLGTEDVRAVIVDGQIVYLEKDQ